jgi:16S rRNA (cytidine1402-2'-O)-methyltransferase
LGPLVTHHSSLVTHHSSRGTLFVVGTPIGNLEDLSRRAERVLREVTLVAAEDTRVTRALLTHFGISTRLLSYREANHQQAAAQVLDQLQRGDVALVCDAGMPAIADPGRRLVAAVRAAGFVVAVVPGPSAVTAALAASSLWADRWLFVGFLPNRPAARRRELAGWAVREETVVAYEAPHRLRETLADLAELLPERSVVLAGELTKRFEQVLLGSASALLAELPEAPRGEYVLVVEGGPGMARPALADTAVERSRLATIAQELGVDRRALYHFLVSEREGRR